MRIGEEFLRAHRNLKTRQYALVDARPDELSPVEVFVSVERPTSDEPFQSQELIVVALGASAGGLEALMQFFENVPKDSGVAFIAVTHQSPTHKSHLAELIDAHTKVVVTEAKDGDELRPNHLYVAPVNRKLEIFHNALQVTAAPAHKSMSFPIDAFFSSLAQDLGERSICVILSGTGTDGTLGLRAIKAEAGMVMVQKPETAKQTGMPQSAIDTGLVDFIAPAEELPSKLLTYVSNSHFHAANPPSGEGFSQVLPKIFRQLRARTGHDFSSYKKSTLRRRIERHMNVNQIESPEIYVQFLEEQPHAIDQLFKELLITVTNFFRDPEAFVALQTQVHVLLQTKADNYTFRAWVAGCATGEEAYSVAMAIHECLDPLAKNFRLQVFGTDLDSDAIETARAGYYPQGIADDVDEKRLRRYFTKQENGFRVKKELREMVIFAPQNIIKDPPFTKLDLLSCRNVLIYLSSHLQERLLPVFHYALKPDSLLLLGPSETIGKLQELFAVEDKKWKLYRRKESDAAKHPEFPLSAIEHSERTKIPAAPIDEPLTHSAEDLIKEHLLAAHVPPTVVVDTRGSIVHVQGKTGPYLELPSGQMSTNLIEMARDELQFDIATAIRSASASDEPVVRSNIKVNSDDRISEVTIGVQRIDGPESIRGLLMVTFETHAESKPTEDPNSSPRLSLTEKKEQELQYMKKTLQSTVEAYDTANEELKSTNEELQSINEELQSANEELETSKEEMQSLNEELQTVNAELTSKLDELSHANDDMQNLLNSTEIATLFLDDQLQIKRFSKSANDVIKVRTVDIGRHFGEVVHELDYVNLVADANRVVETLKFEENEVMTRDGLGCYRVRILPYRTSENMIDGVVVTFIDITDIRKARDYANSIVSTIAEPFVVLDKQLRVVSSNPAFIERFLVKRETVDGCAFYELLKEQWDIPKLKKLLEKVLPEDTMFENQEVTLEFTEIGKKKIRLSGRRLVQQADHRPELILLTFSDVSDAE